MSGTHAIELEGVSKSFGSRAVNVVLDGLDLRVAAGEIHGLLGPNGAGKTTAVKIMTTLVSPESGDVRIAGADAVRSPSKVRQRIGLVGQHAALDEELTGKQNLELFARLNRYTARSARRRAGELLEQFGLVGVAGRRVKTYSGGMRRRVDLAAGLITAPEVLFVDEPTTGLDPEVRGDVWDAIAALAREGTTVLLTTQYLEEADRLAHRISMLGRGRVAEEGTPAELKARIGDDWLEITPGPGRGSDVASDSHVTSANTTPGATSASGAAGDRIAVYREVLAPWASGEIHEDSGVIRLPLADRTGSVLGAAAALRDAGLDVADLSLRTPTLDEVFLEVTGRSALSTEEVTV